MYSVVVKVRPGSQREVGEAIREKQVNGFYPRILAVEVRPPRIVRLTLEDAPLEEILEAMKRLQKNLGVRDIFIGSFSVEAPE